MTNRVCNVSAVSLCQWYAYENAPRRLARFRVGSAEKGNNKERSYEMSASSAP